MIDFQRGTMQSELAFLISQLAKFIFKDAFLILLFISPFPALTSAI